ncbi:hypothetical protein CAPN010_15020 [Capnocytophaga cynodegmi]|uniref:right-handed parallel beta-helix repeat-containing protein n=1 Tax=Capnocytophaga cynodegmi TaxID=28189 RepID=UPI001EE3439C|nr:right-handed parallel beta-helix repeat-containing protein [Capnocytophaga cynodegmi]GJQ07344.1 hypothetical protein CAPN010_15020 [Capnocytophaga cynodegmi]
MKKRIITSLLFLGIIPIIVLGGSSCTFEDILDHSSEKRKELDNGKNNEKEYDFVITPENAKGDFRTFLQNIVNSYKNILIKDGTYQIELIDGKGVAPQNGCNITFEKNAKIKVKPNKLSSYCIIDLRGRKNITIKNPNLEGDKYTHLGTTGQWGHGINVVDCSNINIYNAYATKFWGDGIYLGECENIRIYGAHLVDNRRQGISITSGNDIEIHNLIAENTGGHEPGYGIDIEPNWNGDNITKLRIYKPILRNNGKGKSSYTTGISFSPHHANLLNINKPHLRKLAPTYYDIEIFDPIFEGDALMISASTDYARGSLKVYNPVFYNSKNTALFINNHQSDFFKTEIINPKFINCVEVSASKFSVYFAPVVFTCFKHRGDKNIGNKNISIKNPIFEANDKAKYKIAAIRNSSTNYFKEDLKNVSITNIIVKGYEIPFHNHSGDPNTISTLHPQFSLTFDKETSLPSLPKYNTAPKTFDVGAINHNQSISNSTIYLDEEIPISGFEFFYTNHSKDKSSLKLIFGTKKKSTKAFISKWRTNEFSGIEIPYGGFIKLKKSKLDKQREHWTIVEASKDVKGIK